MLSGPVAGGKSTLRNLLVNRHELSPISTRDLIVQLRPRVAQERAALQRAGGLLDMRTGGKWVADAVGRRLMEIPLDGTIIIDSVRTEDQVVHLRKLFSQRVTHIHVTAPIAVLSERYAARPLKIREFDNYSEVQKDPTEARVAGLEEVADLVLDSDRYDEADLVVRAVAHLGVLPRAVEPIVDVLVGAQYGSEGKGNVAAHLARDYGVLMRVGGPNAGHKVAHPKYTFVHLPSGTSSNLRAKLLIGPGAVIDVKVLMKEIDELGIEASRLVVDENAMIIEEKDKRWEEKRLSQMGSTKQGVGVATARKILGRDEKPVFGSRVRLAKDIPELTPYLGSTAAALDQAYVDGERVFLEGTQGTFLSIHHGPWPYVTSRDTTAAGCLADAGIAPHRARRIIMATRTYPIRVGGKSGPMKREISLQIISERSGVPLDELEKTEKASRTRRSRRIAEFDWSQLKRASTLNGPTDIALTFSDYLALENQKARRFGQLTYDTQRFIDEVERVTGVPVSLISTRFDVNNIIDRRSW